MPHSPLRTSFTTFSEFEQYVASHKGQFAHQPVSVAIGDALYMVDFFTPNITPEARVAIMAEGKSSPIPLAQAEGAGFTYGQEHTGHHVMELFFGNMSAPIEQLRDAPQSQLSGLFINPVRVAVKELERLRRLMPSVDVFQARTFLEAVAILDLTQPSQAFPFRQFRQELKEHFLRNRLRYPFEVAMDDIFLNVLDATAQQMTEESFQKLLRENIKPNDEMVSQLLARIEGNTVGKPSFTGDPQCLVSTRAIAILKYMSKAWPHRVEPEILHEKVLETLASDITAVVGSDSFISIEQAIKSHPMVVPTSVLAEGHRAMYDLRMALGGRWNLMELRDSPLVDSRLRHVLTVLQQWETRTTPAVQQARLEYLQSRHDGTLNHPRVVIEGGGPVGLLQALKAYESGADVTLFEKRDTLYTRPQILRLDPQWLNDLRYYLSSAQFDLLFDTTDAQDRAWERGEYDRGRGRIAADGSGHVSTWALEEVLHLRLSELISLEEHRHGHTGRLQRLAAHEVSGIKPPVQEGDGYRVGYTYEPKNDPTLSDEARRVSIPSEQSIAADVVIAAGGLRSGLREQFFNATAVTSSSYYGVASWENTGHKHRTPPLRDDIHRVVALQRPVLFEFKDLLASVLDPREGSVGPYLSEGAQGFLRVMLNQDETPQTPAVGVAQAIEQIEGAICQLRAFENLGMNYIGMEIPDSLEHWFERVDKALRDDVTIPVADKNEIRSVLKECWFQNMANHLGLDERLKATMPFINRKFTATFPVAQQRIDEGYSDLHSPSRIDELVIIPTGDAVASPHFMTASGLSGGRASANAAIEFIGEMANTSSASERATAKETLGRTVNEVADYVIDRGRDYLSPLTTYQIYLLRREQTLARLDAAVLDPKPKDYTITVGEDPESFIVRMGEEQYTLTLADNGDIVATSPQQQTQHNTLQHFVLTRLSPQPRR